jgi:hypothetical protein
VHLTDPTTPFAMLGRLCVVARSAREAAARRAETSPETAEGTKEQRPYKPRVVDPAAKAAETTNVEATIAAIKRMVLLEQVMPTARIAGTASEQS